MFQHNKNSYIRLIIVSTILVITLQACNLPFGLGATPQAPDSGQESMLQTMTAVQGQLSMAMETINAIENAPLSTPSPPSEEPAPTATLPPTDTPTITPTSTPTYTPIPPIAPIIPTYTPIIPATPIIIVVTATGIPGVPGIRPQISAQVNSNCREGPASNYKRLGYLLVGEISEVFGRDSKATWWYIREPRRLVMCWVWGGSTTVVGDTHQVPIVKTTAKPVSIPKTPSSDDSEVAFAIRGIQVIKCGGQQTVMVKLKNTGDRRFDSASLQVNDLTQGTIVFGPSASNTPFRNSGSDCSAGGDNLIPDAVKYIGGSLGSKNVTNHQIQVHVKLCTGNGLGGSCTSRVASYNVP